MTTNRVYLVATIRLVSDSGYEQSLWKRIKHSDMPIHTGFKLDDSKEIVIKNQVEVIRVKRDVEVDQLHLCLSGVIK